MRSMARSCLAIVLAFGMLNLPTMAAAGQPLGTVIEGQNAHLSNANVVMGSTLYSGDTLATESNGSLRLQVGSGQLYLAPSTSASVSANAKAARISLTRGTVDFSALTSGQLEVETPVAIVRPANGQKAQGEVTVTGANHMTVSAFSGSLVVERGGESRTVEAGKAYSVSFDPNAEPSQNPNGSGTGTYGHRDRGALLFTVLVIGGAAVAGFLIWHFVTESDDNPH